MEVVIYIGLLIFGFMLGGGLVLAIFMACFYDDRWDDGFAKGFVAGEKYIKDGEDSNCQYIDKNNPKRA